MSTNTDSCRSRRCCWRIPGSWAFLIILDFCLVAIALAQDSQPYIVTKSDITSVVTELSGPGDVSEQTVQFEAIDVFVDSGAHPLAAYQFELASQTEGVEIVGIEGGSHSAFSNPPYYDPRAMNNNRVILAAYNTGKDLPSGRSRVARVHVQVRGSGNRAYRTALTASATLNGEQIPAELSIARAQ